MNVQSMKRVTLLAGHYGSGKTNIAVNLALALRKTRDRVTIADLDIVNPYFRTKDSADALREAGVSLISSPYANTNLDIPALPQELYALTDDRGATAVIDVGGDDRGALALGRISGALVEEGDYEMLLVVNTYRPLTRDVPSLLEVKDEIETAAKMPFTGIVNNANLGAETTAEDVLRSVPLVEEMAKASGLPIRFTAVEARLYDALCGKIPHLFPMALQKRPVSG